MANVLLVILLIISVILIGLILIQRSEGGALGIGGGGGGGGGLMSGRGTADMVQKMTAFFGAAFLLVSLLISISFNVQNKDREEFGTTNAPEELSVGELSTSEEIRNNDLPAPVVSDKDTTPLVEDSQSGESDANPEEKPEEKPQD